MRVSKPTLTRDTHALTEFGLTRSLTLRPATSSLNFQPRHTHRSRPSLPLVSNLVPVLAGLPFEARAAASLGGQCSRSGAMGAILSRIAGPTAHAFRWKRLQGCLHDTEIGQSWSLLLIEAKGMLHVKSGKHSKRPSTNEICHQSTQTLCSRCGTVHRTQARNR
jgi:hypothetical protein